MVETTHADGSPFAWEREALCRPAPETFFPNHANESPEPAKAICRRCPVKTPCLEQALAAREAYGIWGGKTTRERRRILKHRGLVAAPADPG